MEQDNNQINPVAQTLTKAIAMQEGGGTLLPYNAKSGDTGNTVGGRYQFLPDTWSNYAGQVLGDSNAPMTPENQNKVAYTKVNTWLNTINSQTGKNYTPAEAASMWNAGEGSPDSWKPGTQQKNGNTPQYVRNVQKYAQQLSTNQQPSSGQNQQPQSGLPSYLNQPETGAIQGGSGDVANGLGTSYTPPQTQDTLANELINRAKDVSGAVSTAATGVGELTQGQYGKGAMDVASGALQTAGGIAGGLGDIVGKGLELIPGVKQVENLMGQGVGALASTPTGQAVAKSISDWSTANPELAKDVGAGFNIVTAIPILRGLGVAGSIAKDAASQALKNVAERSFIEGAPELINSTKAGAKFLTNNPQVTKDMVDRRLVGNIVDGTYTTGTDITKSEGTVKNLNTQVKSILGRPEFSQVSQDGKSIAQQAIQGFTDRNGRVVEGIPHSGMTPEELIANAKKLDPNESQMWDKFEAGQANLQEINNLRSSLDGKVKKVYIGPTSLDTPEIATSKENGALLASAMREAVQTSAPSTAVPFKEMSTQFDIQKALAYMDRKEVKPGQFARFAGHATGIGAGAFTGGLIGGPTGAFVGGMIGDKAATNVASRLAGRNVVQGILKRTGTNAIRTSLKRGAIRVGGLLGGVTAQKLNKI